MRLWYISIPIILVFVLNTAQALTVSPATYSTTQKENSYATILFDLYNGENETVNVTITVDSNLSGKISFSETSFSILNYSHYFVTAVLSRNTQTHGYISFNDLSVEVTVLKNTTNQNNTGNNDMLIIPPNPVAGKNFLIILPTSVNATGYAFCQNSNNVYMIYISNGIGIVNLADDDYGIVSINIFGGARYNKIVNVSSPFNGNLYIDIQQNVLSDENIKFTVYANGNPVPAKVTFKSNHANYTIHANNDGIGSITFHYPGDYSIYVEYLDANASSSIHVSPQPINVVLSKQSIVVGEDVVVQSIPNANIKIKKDEMSWEYISDGNGECYFSPPFSGRYDVYANYNGREGHATFEVKSNTKINIISNDGVSPGRIKKGDTLLLQVVDDNGNAVKNGKIAISCDGMQYGMLDLSAGSTIWTVDVDAYSYDFSYIPSDQSLYLQSSVSYKGSVKITNNKPNSGGFGVLPYALPIAASVVVIILYIGAGKDLFRGISLKKFKFPSFKSSKQDEFKDLF